MPRYISLPLDNYYLNEHLEFLLEFLGKVAFKSAGLGARIVTGKLPRAQSPQKGQLLVPETTSVTMDFAWWWQDSLSGPTEVGENPQVAVFQGPPDIRMQMKAASSEGSQLHGRPCVCMERFCSGLLPNTQRPGAGPAQNICRGEE